MKPYLSLVAGVLIGLIIGVGFTVWWNLSTTPRPSSANTSTIITSLSPYIAHVGDPSFTLTVNGKGFVNGSQIFVDGSAQTTTFVSSTKLTMVVPTLTQTGVLNITANGPGGTSNTMALSVSQ